MISGIGTDIVAVPRLRAALERRGPALARRLLAETEWPDFDRAADPARLLAKRFAAKEAFLKALGTGLRGLRWTDMAVQHDRQGKPSLWFSAALASRLAGHRCHLSLSDEQDYAMAFVIIESES